MTMISFFGITVFEISAFGISIAVLERPSGFLEGRPFFVSERSLSAGATVPGRSP